MQFSTLSNYLGGVLVINISIPVKHWSPQNIQLIYDKYKWNSSDDNEMNLPIDTLTLMAAMIESAKYLPTITFKYTYVVIQLIEP